MRIKVKNILTFIYAMLFSVIGIACSQIFEEDISDKQLNVIAPSNNVQTPYYNQVFWWDKLDGATQYRLQIVSPSFNNLQLLIIDSTTTSDKITYTLRPGTYQWRIRAENFSYQTEYVTRELIVDTSSLNLQYVSLLLPASSLSTRNPGIDFSWIPIFGASKYYIEIDDINGNFTNVVKKDSTSNSYYSYSLNTDGEYKWRVRATDGSVYTTWSDVRSIELDRVSPGQVSLSSPATAVTISTPYPFSWNPVSDAYSYRFYLYKSDSVTVYNTNYPLTVTSTQVSISDGVSHENLVWAVKAVDRAGNVGPLSLKRKFTIQ
jgi:hypothetical protein